MKTSIERGVVKSFFQLSIEVFVIEFHFAGLF